MSATLSSIKHILWNTTKGNVIIQENHTKYGMLERTQTEVKMWCVWIPTEVHELLEKRTTVFTSIFNSSRLSSHKIFADGNKTIAFKWAHAEANIQEIQQNVLCSTWSSGCRIITNGAQLLIKMCFIFHVQFLFRFAASQGTEAGRLECRHASWRTQPPLILSRDHPGRRPKGKLLMMLWLIAFIWVYGVRITLNKLLYFLAMSEETNHTDKDLWTYSIIHLVSSS